MKKYGEKRCFDTPISEMSFAGMTVGARFLGFHPMSADRVSFSFKILKILLFL